METTVSLSFSELQSSNNESLLEEGRSCALEATVVLDATRIEFIDSMLLYSRLQIVYIFVVIPIITSLAVITNGSYLFVVAKTKSMHTVINIYLCNLAVADVLFLLSSCGIYIYYYFISGGVYANLPNAGTLDCNSSQFANIFYVTSAILIVAVTLDRYYAVCYPLKHRMFSKTRAIKITIAAWVFAVLYRVKDVLVFWYKTRVCVIWPDLPRYSELSPVLGYCDTIFTEEVRILVVHFFDPLLFVLMMLANSFMYFKIVKALKNRPAQRDGQQGLSDSADRTRRSVTRMLLANSIVFFILTAPEFIQKSLHGLQKFKVELPPALTNVVGSHVTSITTNILVNINSMVNPIIYNVANSRYRQAYREAFLPCRQTADRQRRKQLSGNIVATNMTVDS
ncbi:neuropeptide FF receptor 2-like [Patiria miniata]|uniref:G-protein coupled receptors family 1 profile domain-containing protein n=1 Tax=Patiria miniata TaxID=46514 RepID=A0A914B233_PATMI|nr:neuropeptide FF receptor 2-like [Patiria miniata]